MCCGGQFGCEVKVGLFKLCAKVESILDNVRGFWAVLQILSCTVETKELFEVFTKIWTFI